MADNNHRETVVVTGASAGLGRAIARAFGKEKAKVGLLARNAERLEAAKHEIEEMGGEALPVPTDVSDADQVEAAASAVEDAFGPIDVWVNDAMTGVFSPFKDMTSEEFKRVTEVTYLGVVYGTMSALHRMLPRDRGVIVQIGSALAKRSIPLQSAYCGAKHAIVGFTDSIRSELIHDKSNVRITVVHMPGLNTPQFEWCKSHLDKEPQPVPPIFEPEVGADAVVWAAHHRKREMYVGFPTVKAIWGAKFFNSLIDWYLARKGYSGQMTTKDSPPNRPSDLYDSVPGEYAAHGRFDGKSKKSSLEVALVKLLYKFGL